jgi:hypothetical protein
MTISVSQISNTQTFGAWLTTTNRLAEIASQNTITADSSSGGSVTTGNSFVNGHFGTQFLYVSNTISGGQLSAGPLRLLANVAVTNSVSNVFVITSNSTSSNVVLSGNVTFVGATILANGSSGSVGQVLTSNGTGLYWSNILSGVTLAANNTDAQSFFFPMTNTTSGEWSNGVISNTKLFFVPSTGTLNATIFNSLSDRSSKVEIQILDNALDLVKLIDGVEFKWKDNHHKSAGVIAQEVEKVIPYLVETSESGIKSVNYNGLIGFLVESIKTLSNEIEELKISINRQ